ncbi:MAG: hypothetical protein ABI789_08540 [Usitatibacter sp.]
MHVCPHCQKLGISTYAAIGDPFSRGLASCRYCHNISKRRRRPGANFAAPVAIFAFMALIYFFPQSLQHVQVGLLWFAFLILIAAIVSDRLTDFEREKSAPSNPSTASREEQQL